MVLCSIAEMRRTKKTLRSFAWLLGALLLASFTQWPALGGELFDDDYAQLGFLLAKLGDVQFHPRNRLDLYNFGEVSFFRPLTSALMNADAWAFETNLRAFHAHSLLWYLGVVTCAGLLVRRVAPAISVPFGLVFAGGGAAGTSVVWWCNRHLLVSGLFGCLSLLAHVAWRERGWRAGRVLSPLALVGSLLASEAGAQTVAFLVAYELLGASNTRETKARAERRFAIGGMAVVTATHFAVRRSLGYGVDGNLWEYVDPMSDPIRFLAVAFARLPDLARLLVSGGASAAVSKAGAAGATCLTVAVAGAALALFVRPSWTALPEREMRAARWLTLGGALSVPISLTSPQPIVRLMPSVGIATVVSVLLFASARLAKSGGPQSGDARAVRRVARALGVVAFSLLAVVYVVAAPIAARAETARHAEEHRVSHRAMIDAPIRPSDRAVLLTTLRVNVWQTRVATTLFRRDVRAESWTYLDLGDQDLSIARSSPSSLVVERTDAATFRSAATVSAAGPPFVRVVTPAVTGRVELVFGEPPVEEVAILGFRHGRLVRMPLPSAGEPRQRW